MTTFYLILLGILTGAMAGVTGASGVLILIPILSTFSDISLPIILGTSLLVDVIVSISVSSTYARSKNVDVKGIIWVLVGTLIGAQIGSFFVISISRVLIIIGLVIFMIFFGIKMWQSGSLKQRKINLILPEKFFSYLNNPISMILMGLLVGLSTGIFGAGGGLIIFIILYYFLKFPIKKAVGTSSFVMLLTALSGVLGYANNGNLDIHFGLIIGISAAIGGIFSSVIANKIDEKLLARIIGGFFIFFAIIMLILKVIFPLFNLDF